MRVLAVGPIHAEPIVVVLTFLWNFCSLFLFVHLLGLWLWGLLEHALCARLLDLIHEILLRVVHVIPGRHEVGALVHDCLLKVDLEHGKLLLLLRRLLRRVLLLLLLLLRLRRNHRRLLLGYIELLLPSSKHTAEIRHRERLPSGSSSERV